MNDDSIMVDIPMCAYNHEQFIGQAIEGVLNQKVNFSYRLLIGEDCSRDNTREVIKRYLPGNEDRIKAIFHEKNVGAEENTRILFNQCTAKYVALLDGDDYWTDPYKLQKQVDLLESRPEIMCHFHNARVVDKNGFVRLYNDFTEDVRVTQDEIVKSLSIPTASVVFRNKLREMPEWLQNFFLDITIYFYIAGFGDFYGSTEVMSVYRIHDGGFWTGQNAVEKLTNHISIRHKMIDKLPLSNAQKKTLQQIIMNLQLQRMSYLADKFSFNSVYFKDLFGTIWGKFSGYEVNTKFLIFCALPQKFISLANNLRRKK